MKRCVDCIYFLPHKSAGFNCGYLMKNVDGSNGCCRYFRSLNEGVNA